MTLLQIAAIESEKNKKTDKKKELSELNELFKPVVAAQKVSRGTQSRVVLDTLISFVHRHTWNIIWKLRLRCER